MRPVLLRALVTAAVALPFAAGAAATPASTAEEGTEVVSFTDPDIVESSGLAVVGGRFVTVNDSGDSGRVFAVDPATGDTVGVTSWTPDPVDVEAVAPAYVDGEAASEVWVGDIGDNRAVRDSVEVLRVPVGWEDATVEPARYELQYADGPRDAESVLVVPGTDQLLVVSKGVLGGSFYAAPEQLVAGQVNVLEPLAPALGVATDAAFFPDGRHLVVRNYGAAAVYTYPGLTEVGSFDLPEQPQGEGIAVDPDDPGAVLLTTEGPRTPVLRVALPADVSAAMAPESPDAGSTDTPDGGADADPAVDPADDGPGWLPWIVGGAGGVVLLVLAVTLARGSRRS
ncbi:hypothetical protein QE364_002906 [Nocardioides zeae]|uniref:Uncharacterized protein n=2 Tax=Nocardioides zeae TaxID=1457234 RepID=A0ACC6IKR5_9ACTN|nr:hypothetical protein [Nocardioides zeae]MDR6175323.1 hypothetical protein [Nocardioides zeae]MDR6211185.1 hypothetical protein [Nocardioides zeae]